VVSAEFKIRNGRKEEERTERKKENCLANLPAEPTAVMQSKANIPSH
jgi:hypothetical protein